MTYNRVVITGLGAVTPLGIGIVPTWEGMVAGRSGVGPITAFDASNLTSRIAGQVDDFDPTVRINLKEARRMDRYAQFAVYSALEAVEDSGLDIPASPERVGVIFGSGIGGIGTTESQAYVLKDKGPRRLSPFMIPMLIADMGAGLISIRTGAQGPNYAVVSACATGIHAISDAAHTIGRGEADAVITGGSEATLTELSAGGFCAMRALSTRNDEPERASRPFDKGRDGFVMGEGAGALILESLDHATKRGANIYGEIVGMGASGDAHHMSAPAPGGKGAVRSMQAAMQRSKISPEDIQYVNCHGTSTPLGDIAEVQALHTVFGSHAEQLMVSATKSMTGHMLGAAGAIESIACLLAMRDGVLPPTINNDDPDPECDLDCVPNEAREVDVDVTLNNAFGFGGHNATIIFRKYTG